MTRLRGSATINEETVTREIRPQADSQMSGAESPSLRLQQEAIARLAGVCATIAADDPSGAKGTDLSKVFEPFDMTQSAAVRVAWGGSHLDAAIYPLLAGLPKRREAIILITELAPHFAILAESWSRMASWGVGEVPWPHEFLAFRSLDPPLAYFRTARKPHWLLAAHGADIRRILEIALAPVIAALKPDALSLLASPNGTVRR